MKEKQTIIDSLQGRQQTNTESVQSLTQQVLIFDNHYCFY